MTREYELKRRADQMADTRHRIVEAAVELHRTLGPARTTISAIAREAGVQRQTYYRHFPEERQLLLACSGLFFERNPLPDPEAWRAIADPHDRLCIALTEVYAYYAANEEMLASVLRDAAVHDPTREIVEGSLVPAMAALVGALVESFEGTAQLRRLQATLELLLDFASWRRFVRGSGLCQDEAVELAVDILRSLD